MRGLTVAIGAAAVALLIVITRVQVLHADDIVVRPHLGLQADGSRRYQYNPRVLDLVRQIPRGSIVDRAGLPLATDDAALLAKAAPDYGRLGIVLKSACPDAAARCYPLGGRAFHLLGRLDHPEELERQQHLVCGARQRVEAPRFRRSANSRPRDDRRRREKPGRCAATTGICCRLLRHRHDPDDPAMKALLARPRDLQLTIDAAPPVARGRDRCAAGRGLRRRAGLRRSCSTPTPATCWPASVIPGRSHRPTDRPRWKTPTAIRSSIARVTACTRRDRRSSSSPPRRRCCAILRPAA